MNTHSLNRRRALPFFHGRSAYACQAAALFLCRHIAKTDEIPFTAIQRSI